MFLTQAQNPTARFRNVTQFPKRGAR
jgi:hypothetical protein